MPPCTPLGMYTPVYTTPCTPLGRYLLPYIPVYSTATWSTLLLTGCTYGSSHRGSSGSRGSLSGPSERCKTGINLSERSSPWGYTLGLGRLGPLMTVLASQGPEPPLSPSEGYSRLSLFNRVFKRVLSSFIPVLYLPGMILLSRTVQPWGYTGGNWQEWQKEEKEEVYSFDERMRVFDIPCFLVQQCFL